MIHRMVKITEKLHKAIGALEWFTTRQWHFKCNNVLALSSELKGKDKEVGIFLLFLSLTLSLFFPSFSHLSFFPLFFVSSFNTVM